MSLHPILDQALAEGIFPITKRITIGQFASDKRCQRLVTHGVTHVLNVAEAESLASTVAAFRKVIDVPIEDLTPIPMGTGLFCVEAIHQVMSSPDTKLYIHCIAGQNRSPTVLWLYLLACGMDINDAKHLIVRRAPDAVPGHGSLVDSNLVHAVRSVGVANQMKPTDLGVLQPAY